MRNLQQAGEFEYFDYTPFVQQICALVVIALDTVSF